MDEVLGGHAVVSGRPPKIPMAHSKRHSLQSGDSITKFNKLKKHASQPKLRKDVLSGSLECLNLDSSRRYSSLAQLNVQSLKASAKTLSASNLAAISDSNLSLKEAIPLRSYDQPNSSFADAKSHFEELVKCYFRQLTKGCGDESCQNKFCVSSKGGVKLAPDVAGIMSIELATRNKQYICTLSNQKTGPLPAKLFEGEPNKPRPFLHCLFSTTPFQTLFQPFSQRRHSEKGSNFPTNLIKSKKIYENQISGSWNIVETEVKAGDADKEILVASGDKSVVVEEIGKKGTHLQTDEVKEAPKRHVFNLDTEFSKVNLSGNLMTDHALPGMPPELFSSNSSLNDIVDLEEFEKECALEMSSGHIQEFSLTHLTLPMLESSAENYNQCKDAAFLINTIRTVFTSSEALNDSFRTANGEHHNSLDVPAVREAYKLLLSLEPQNTFVQPLLNSLEIHLTTLSSLVLNPDRVAQLVILIENPLVQDSQALLWKMCLVLSNLSVDSRKALIKILSCYDVDSFKHLLKVFQTYLSSLISPGQCSKPRLLEACKTLAILYDTCYQLNKKRKEEFVPLSDFYNEDLSLKMDFKKEYEHWRTLRESNRSQSGQKLSLLDYPFLFDPTSKVRVLKIDAVSQMRVEYQNAIVHQARVQQAQRLWEEAQKKTNELEDAVKSAMCPFLVLEVRRDSLIEDTLNQINLKVCGGEVLTLFRPDELELLICGCPVIDFYELEVAATYEDGYNHSHPTITMLWKVVNEMTLEQKKAFLMFVTGSDRVPLKGLVNFTFIVQRHGEDSDRLPTALTCFNRLLLPEYSTRVKLKERLIVAIENCKGFGLT